MRVDFQRDTVAFSVPIQVYEHVAALCRDGGRGGVAGGFEHSAEQDWHVDQLAVGLFTDLR
ncbi:hypothetical protein D3C84_1238430 [compost metagenome]